MLDPATTPFVIMLTSVFIAGVSVEALAVLWVHYSERNQKLPLFIVSTCLGAAQVLGIGGAINNWQCALAFILGYGFGPLLGLWIKARMVSP